MDKETTRVTIEDLADMMQGEFLATRKDFGALRSDFETLETNLATMIAELPTRAEIKDLLRLDHRVAELERQMLAVRERLPTIEV